MGNKVCIVKVKKGNEIEDYSFTVKVIDTEAPELTVGGDGITFDMADITFFLANAIDLESEEPET